MKMMMMSASRFQAKQSLRDHANLYIELLLSRIICVNHKNHKGELNAHSIDGEFPFGTFLQNSDFISLCKQLLSMHGYVKQNIVHWYRMCVYH
jgi:hypothetical protein